MSASPDGFIFILSINTSKNYQNTLPWQPLPSVLARNRHVPAGPLTHHLRQFELMPHHPSPRLLWLLPCTRRVGPAAVKLPRRSPWTSTTTASRAARARGRYVNLPVPRWALGLGLPGRASSGVSGRREGKAGPTRSREQRGPRVRRSASTARRGRVHSVSRSPGKRVLLLLGFQDY